MIAVAAMLALLAIGVLTACIILAINVALPAWLAALIVGIAYLIIAGVFVSVGMARLRRAGKPLPEQTIETIKEDVSWARHRAKSATT
jgi:high-affinity Fe2+/Pb2+ permease